MSMGYTYLITHRQVKKECTYSCWIIKGKVNSCSSLDHAAFYSFYRRPNHLLKLRHIKANKLDICVIY